MVLVDTSVWIDHLRRGDSELQELLRSGQVATHPFIIGEIACGNLKNGNQVLGFLQNLPKSKVATQSEALTLIEDRSLHGKGLGFIDIHLLAAALLSHIPLWTRDTRLTGIAELLGVAQRL
jgi:predicted nucleic acid-binding protein